MNSKLCIDLLLLRNSDLAWLNLVTLQVSLRAAAALVTRPLGCRVHGTPGIRGIYALGTKSLCIAVQVELLNKNTRISVEIITQTKKREKEKENKHARKSLGFILYHIPLEEVLSLSLLDILPLLYHTRVMISYELKTIVKKWNKLNSQTPEISVSKHRLQKSSFHRAFFRLTDLLSAGGRR